MSTDTSILGHTCKGLAVFQAFSEEGCTPEIDELGRVQGCDAHNPIHFRFCPFCAEAFTEPPTKCASCGLAKMDHEMNEHGLCWHCEGVEDS